MAKQIGYLNDDTFTNIATAIRSKNGSASKYTPSEMVDAINALSTGGINTNDATMTSDDVLKDKTGYANGVKVTGTLQVVNYYSGIDDPDSSFGDVNDIYIKIEE